jgi:hypothetical protein
MTCFLSGLTALLLMLLLIFDVLFVWSAQFWGSDVGHVPLPPTLGEEG